MSGILNKTVSVLLGVFILCIAVVYSDSDSEPEDEVQFISRDPNRIKFYLFPNSENVSDYDELKYLDIQSINNSRFSSEKNTIILTHGFTNNFLSEMPQIVVKAYLRQGFARNSNIITTDWGDLSGFAANIPWPPLAIIAELPLYIGARWNVPRVGKRIQEFITFLEVNQKISGPEAVHLVGHSLGAHVSGMAGMYYAQNTSTQLARISGTDPAGPLFQLTPPSGRIDPTDAKFVDITHSNQGEFGFLGILGQVDFYVNGGGPIQIQPGCELTVVTDPGCSHRRGPQAFAQSIINHSLLGHASLGFPWFGARPNSAPVIFGEFASPSTKGQYKVRVQFPAQADPEVETNIISTE